MDSFVCCFFIRISVTFSSRRALITFAISSTEPTVSKLLP
nr:MAG TPA: hypothetical protein [Caudoviricetes sp.]